MNEVMQHASQHEATNGYPTQASRCAIYCRYSSEQQRDSMSIEAQRRECLAFAEKQGWTVHKVYVDEARSGTSDDRAAFQEMISDATGRQPPFQFVLVHKLDRFARNRYDSIRYKHILKRKGVRVVSASQPILGTGDPTEVILESVLEGMDEFYSLNLSREVIKGMSENARHGWWNGNKQPFGYTFEPEETPKGTKRKLVIEESEAQVVRLIFSWYLAGQGIGAIRSKLSQQGIRTRCGAPFTKNTILGILRSEKYVGDVMFGKRLIQRRARKPQELNRTTVLLQNVHPPIIGREDWEMVQSRLTARQKALMHPRASASDYLFTGLIRCGRCGAMFVGNAAFGRNGRYQYYTCGKHLRGGPAACCQKNFRADVLEPLLVNRLKARLAAPEALASLIRDHNDTLKEAQRQRAGRLRRLEREIEGLETRRKRLFDSLERGLGLNEEDIAPRLRELAALKQEKQRELDELKQALATQPIVSSEEAVAQWVELLCLEPRFEVQ